MTSPFARRRAFLAARMRAAASEGGSQLAILMTAPLAWRNGDSEYAYRHDSSFNYLTGFSEPESCLVLASDGRSTLFCRDSDAEREVWEGRHLGVAAAPQRLGIDEAYSIERLDELMPRLLGDRTEVWTPFGKPPEQDGRLARWLEAVRSRARQGVHCPEKLRNLAPLLDEMRLMKDAGEIDTMRRAAAVSAQAHARAMRYCAMRIRGSAGGNPALGRSALREYEVEAELLHEFRRHGSQAPAYTSIVAAGANACVLHYPAGNAELRDGELCLIDAGCELDGYASDISRTFPVNGRFTAPQRRLYGIVLAAQEAAIAATAPGRRLTDAHHAAVRVLCEGMLDAGLLDRARHGGVDDVIESGAYRRFYMHSTGHWLGMDVHDVGDYLSRSEAPVEQPDGQGGKLLRAPSRVLVPGMAVTIEPGIYVRPADDVPPEFWNIGVRIEDDAIVNEGGCELISRGVPVAPDEIEALMREAG